MTQVYALSDNSSVSLSGVRKMRFKFRVYTVEDGIASNESHDDSHFIDPITGEMYFGGGNGFTLFHPDSIRDDT